MFPHQITIYRHTVDASEADVYTRQVIRDVYVNDAVAVRVNDRGDISADGVTVVTTPALAASLGSAWTVQPGDRIMRGAGPAITSLRDLVGLADVWTVLRVRRHTPGGTVDNIVIEGA